MTYPYNEDDFVGIINGINNSVVSLPQSELIISGEFLTSGRSGVLHETGNAVRDATSILLVYLFEFFNGRGLDEEAIFFHFF